VSGHNVTNDLWKTEICQDVEDDEEGKNDCDGQTSAKRQKTTADGAEQDSTERPLRDVPMVKPVKKRIKEPKDVSPLVS